jgi:NAD(P)-dependent dehydrogenase (short-subunit alcohol dehydrogenase family)
LTVNLFGIVKVTRAFLPLLKRSKGAIINNLSLAALAPLPVIPGYSMSKAAALNMTQSLRARLAGLGVSVHAVILGPSDTDMNRGFDIPKAAPATAAKGIFDGLERGEEEIFPDPASQSSRVAWSRCVQRDAARAGRSRASPVAPDGGSFERQQSATAPITCGSPRREGGRRLRAGGYALYRRRPHSLM